MAIASSRRVLFREAPLSIEPAHYAPALPMPIVLCNNRCRYCGQVVPSICVSRVIATLP